MINKLGLRAKMILSICSVVLISYTISIFYITLNASKMAQIEAKDKAFEIASKYGQMIRASLNNAMDITNTVASSLEGMKISGINPNRQQINELLKNVLHRNPYFIAIGSCWEPNALDGKDAEYVDQAGHDSTGRFIPYWNRGSGSIKVEPLVNYDTEDWYQVPKKTGNEMITEPYVYPVGNKKVLMATVVTPIKINNRFLGIVSIDISLDTFGKMMEAVKPFETGYGYLLSNQGYIVSHPLKKVVDKNVGDIITDKDKLPLLKAIKEGRSYAMFRNSSYGEMDTYQILVPIKVGQTNTPWSIGIVAPLNKILSDAIKLRNTSILIGIVSFLVLVTVVWFISAFLVLKPINQAVEGLRDIAEGDGDLTLRLPVNTNDEIGDLSTWFNTFIEKLQYIIGDLTTQAETMDGSSLALLEVASGLSKRAVNTSERSTSVSGAAEEMAKNITGVASSMKEASAKSDMVATAAEEMTATINEVATQSENARTISEEAVNKASNTSEKMGRLGEAASAIGSVTESISEISEQTNLLALNATIEAARAGEAGKGFAVVANEIKELANQTAKATRDIKDRVDGIQSVTKETVMDIEQVTGVIDKVNTIVGTIATAVKEQSLATSEIATNIAQTSQGIQKVSGIISQNTNVVGEITGEITAVNTNAGEISKNSVQVHTSAEELSNIAQNLKQVVGSFKI